VAALAVGGAAVVGIGVGGYFGIDAISKHADSNRGCPAGQCTAQAVAENSQSQTSADRSTVAFGVSLGALAVATYLWLSGGSTKNPSSSALVVAPIVRGDGGGISLACTF
jgi:predicted alpha/beta-fold hydrolase